MSIFLDSEDPTASALARYEQSKRDIRFWIIVAGVWELALLVTLIVLIDWSNRTHIIVLAAALLVYGALACGLIALGAYVRTNALRVLTGVEAMAGDDR